MCRSQHHDFGKESTIFANQEKMCNHFAEGVGINAHEEPSDALVVPLLFLPRSLTVLWCKVTIHS